MSTLARTSPPARQAIVWAVLSSFAIAYIGGLILRPDVVGAVLPQVKLAALLMDEDDTEVRRAAAESETLRRALYGARAELANMRMELARRTDREAALTQRLAALEAREATRLAEAEAEAQTKTAATVAGKKEAVAKLVEKAAAAKSAAAAVKPAPAPPAAPPAKSAVERLAEISGSAAPAASQRPSAPVTETASLPGAGEATVGIMLGTGPSVDSLRLNWAILTQRHQEDLQRLQPRYAANKSIGGQGPAYDLVAGPLPNAAEAQKVCASLRAKMVPCKVAPYTGGNL